MELTLGYKCTDIGVIPEDWEPMPLKEITLDILQGINTAVDIPDYVFDGIPMLKANNVIDQALQLDFVDYVSEQTYSKYSERYRVKQGDFLFSNIGARLGTGSIFKQQFECTFAWNVMRIIPNKKMVYPEFLAYLINSPMHSKRIKSEQSGSGMGFIPKTVMQKVVLPIPKDLTEQDLIVTTLSDIDALIDSLSKLVTKKCDIKQATMQQLLTGKTRLPGFTGRWGIKLLGELANFHKGKGLPKNAISSFGSESCVHYGELFTQYNEIIDETISRTNQVAEVFRSIANDVLMPTSDVTPRGLAKASCITIDDVVLGGDILVIRADPTKTSGAFLSYVIRLSEDQVLGLVTGSTVFHLYASDMKGFNLKMPPTLAEQKAIVAVLSDMDNEIAALEKRLEKTRLIKQGMMQELLTGRIRLV